MTDTERQSNKRGLILLALGAMVGLGLAGASIIADRQQAKDALGDSVAAKVNHVLIGRDIYEAQIERLASDKKDPMTDEDRAYVLERIIEEELLIQRGVEIGLVERERAVRAAIVTAMISSITADTQAMQPTQDELEDFYAANSNYFVRSAHLHARDLYVSLRKGKPTADKQMQQAQQALRDGRDFATVKAQYGDPQVLQLPDTLLPAAKLRDYLGPTILQELMVAQAGDVIGPIETPGGLHLVKLVAVERDAPPPLAEIREIVVGEYRKRAGDKALRDYLEWLKARAELIRIPSTQVDEK